MPALFQLDQVARSFRQGDAEVRALDDVCLTVDEGELLAIAGPSGSGKTTLLSIMSLLDDGYTGELRFLGQSARGRGTAERARLRLACLGLVFQRFHLLAALDALENVALPHWRLHGDRRRARERACELLAQFGMEHRAHHTVARLSGGEAQRVALARALVNDPPVVLADEPTGQLSGEDSARIVAAFRAVHDLGKTVVFVSHDPELIATAGRVVGLRHGRTVSPELHA